MIEDIQIIIMNLNSVKEAVTKNDDGTYTIFINDNLNPQAKYDAYQHAIGHIQNDDFSRDDFVDRIEFENHK